MRCFLAGVYDETAVPRLNFKIADVLIMIFQKSPSAITSSTVTITGQSEASMRQERDLRRPRFRGGFALRLVDGQVWSLPTPDEPVDATVMPGASWRGPDYRALLSALAEAGDESELFLAELALAIHLITWNYEVDGPDLVDIFDDRDGDRARAELSLALHALATAHLRSAAGRPGLGLDQGLGWPDPAAPRPAWGFVSRFLGLRWIRRARDTADQIA